MRIEHLPYEGTELFQRHVDSYLLHYRGYYGNTHEQFESLEKMELFAKNILKTIRKYKNKEL